LRVMHYTEHAQIHPLIVSGELNKIGTAANKAASLARWKC
jgi:hypothetical protein